MTVSDNTISAEGLGDLLKNLGKKRLHISKNMAENILKNPGRALEIGANVGTASASRSLKTAQSGLPEVLHFNHIGKRLYLGKFA